MSRMGRSSSTSMGTLVLWIHVLVQRCRSLTYEFLQAEPGEGHRMRHGVSPSCLPSPTPKGFTSSTALHTQQP